MYRAMGHALGADLMERYEFDCEGDRLVGNLHLPQGDAHGVAILTGPLTSVKEQATGAWASALAKRGFVALRARAIAGAAELIDCSVAWA